MPGRAPRTHVSGQRPAAAGPPTPLAPAGGTPRRLPPTAPRGPRTGCRARVTPWERSVSWRCPLLLRAARGPKTTDHPPHRSHSSRNRLEADGRRAETTTEPVCISVRPSDTGVGWGGLGRGGAVGRLTGERRASVALSTVKIQHMRVHTHEHVCVHTRTYAHVHTHAERWWLHRPLGVVSVTCTGAACRTWR